MRKLYMLLPIVLMVGLLVFATGYAQIPNDPLYFSLVPNVSLGTPRTKLCFNRCGQQFSSVRLTEDI